MGTQKELKLVHEAIAPRHGHAKKNLNWFNRPLFHVMGTP
jgi:hypothetical protein